MRRIWTDTASGLLALIAGLGFVAPAVSQSLRAEPPLAASDWLSGSLQPPRQAEGLRRGGGATPAPNPAPRPRQVAESADTGTVAVTRLGPGNPDGKGTIPPRKLGLPDDLWSGTPAPDLARMLAETRPDLPVLRDLLRRLMLAQFRAPPLAGGVEGGWHLARVDRLLDMAALDDAHALIEVAGLSDAERFRRHFDIDLIEGKEAHACTTMTETPGIAPSYEARIFCLAASGDWPAAATVFYAADALALIRPEDAPLLAHFLDDSLVDTSITLEPPARITPLTFRLFEAIGQPLPTTGLPLPLARADLRMNGGWKARLDAAERLARAGVIDPALLHAIYTEQRPAASGGSWDRAAAVQALDAALISDDRAAVGVALDAAFAAFTDTDMGAVLAAIYAPDQSHPLPDALPDGPGAQALALLQGFQGSRNPDLPPVLADGLTAEAALPDPAQRGAALLTAISDTDAGLVGDLPRAARGLAVLRALGLEAEARQAAAQIALWPALNRGNR
ncbi:MAG: hypothetical protein Q4G24_12865 [Paracoccus sp. (in: a-proteobacteria)]|uniref:hypothetical protein n=1 Tax=Paracoccus sp. TaxID=267 RepID=UPI0026DEAB35|nr:hypothetical protein [Paracoccus sp. (in: a-proteobacteria)]MDO5622351.1 hypothetical protein [Paracoccus sp. (in: a-proteobacteria)]